jgi:hypothetical protein
MTLQNLLITLRGQKLTAGYLPVFGDSTAHDTFRGLKNQFDPFTLVGNPLPSPYPPLLTPAWIASLDGQDAIYLDGYDGNVDLSKTPKPAYTFTQPV